jgi:hypothetical protein
MRKNLKSWVQLSRQSAVTSCSALGRIDNIRCASRLLIGPEDSWCRGWRGHTKRSLRAASAHMRRSIVPWRKREMLVSP